MSAEIAIGFFTLIAFLAFAGRRLMRYLHNLQQEDYDNGRLLGWIFRYKVLDKRISFILFLLVLGAYFKDLPVVSVHIGLFLIFVIAFYTEADPRKAAKKAFVLTARAKRILVVSLLYTTLIVLAGFYLAQPAFWIIHVQLLPFILMLGNLTLEPYERLVQRKFYDDARAKLTELNPTIIAITGSYGKTSVKHILGHILKNSAPTLITPGSVNTLMGITRIIREQLGANHRYFIVEMGAYGPGSIESLCKLTPPDYGIISSIGHAHYERFKTLDTVVRAKYELAKAVLENNGTMIVHEKTLKFKYSQSIRHQNMDSFIACGEPLQAKSPQSAQEYSYLTPDDLNILSIEQTPKGLCIHFEWKDEKYTLRAPLYGIHHGHNIALAFACAMTLGIDAKDIKMALASTPQITHRLEVKQQIDGSIIIDDAFNSNPPGFRSAMHVLRVLADDRAGRAILVTPGIVELGNKHNEVHRTLGVLAAEVCDIVMVVSPSRIPTFIEGFKSVDNSKTLQQFETFSAAEKWLIKNKRANDVILLENDLPDLYERILKI
ncbi:MAG: UDP-N-acetylmuramoyl-tripeptide--D-alanyl-D-alanine ligase [Alphaproteobacteria bacterium]|nr:UDP-N-acetylmuramoyl-tripeptide--D-alanyl-D-alanine ligase [Alphaproteobacteria bacterium]